MKIVFGSKTNIGQFYFYGKYTSTVKDYMKKPTIWWTTGAYSCMYSSINMCNFGAASPSQL